MIGFDAAAKWLDEALGAGLGKLYDNVLDKRWDERLGSFSIHRTSAEGIPGVFLSFQLFKNLYVEIDLGRGLEYLKYSGPLAPFNILSEYLFGKIIGSPTTVEFSKDAPEVKDDEIFSFTKMNKSINARILK